ncbi:MAG: glycosyltransferase [Geobacteraceae bacterium]|nr:glycosyltransferase [Geobacteraceae bacterium]NTW81223.1 glycosyltransferase [Geobacteraceae bacterium]
MSTVSIIIPVKPGGYVAACQHLKKVMSDDPRYEIILAEGSAPSQQRNRAAREAVGDILYFLDDDSLIVPENLDCCCEAMSDPAVAVVGGPSLTPDEDSWLQQLFGQALASKFGSGAVNNRYRSFGQTRKTTDKELILCNLAVRRSVFIDLKGFNECLYPNEENEFMERVTSAGYSLLHVPSMLVFRSQRNTLKAFIRQMFNYGRGRGQQTLITRSYSVTSFIPLFFVAYLFLSLVYIKNLILLSPLVIYICAASVFSLSVLQRTGRLYSLLLLGIYPLMHIVNGVGLLCGLLSGKPDQVQDSSIRIRIIKRLGESFPE